MSRSSSRRRETVCGAASGRGVAPRRGVAGAVRSTCDSRGGRGADRFPVRLQSGRAGHPSTVPLPAAPNVHIPRVARRADRSYDLLVRACTGRVPGGAGDASGGLRVRRRDGRERAAPPARVDLYEESDAGGVLGPADSRGGGLSAGDGGVAQAAAFTTTCPWGPTHSAEPARTRAAPPECGSHRRDAALRGPG